MELDGLSWEPQARWMWEPRKEPQRGHFQMAGGTWGTPSTTPDAPVHVDETEPGCSLLCDRPSGHRGATGLWVLSRRVRNRISLMDPYVY